MKILFVWLVALAGMVSTVEAATYYVAIAGSDSNSGSQSSPFRTVKKGISILKPGDKLYIRGGNYGEIYQQWESNNSRRHFLEQCHHHCCLSWRSGDLKKDRPMALVNPSTWFLMALCSMPKG